MTDTIAAEREKELRVLLEQIRTHPSADMTKERERVTLLTKLLAERTAPA